MSLGDYIKVGPWLQGYVRVSREGSFEESQRRWPRLRKVLVRYGGEHEPWQNRKDPYSTSDGEKFIDVAMEEDWRPALVADLEAAGFDVIDDVGQTAPRHPYRESKSMKITAGQLRRIIKEEISRAIRESQTWTAVVRWPSGESEEVDVQASSKDEAKKAVEAKLKDPDEYSPGGKIVGVAPAGGFSIRKGT